MHRCDFLIIAFLVAVILVGGLALSRALPAGNTRNKITRMRELKIQSPWGIHQEKNRQWKFCLVSCTGLAALLDVYGGFLKTPVVLEIGSAFSFSV